MPLRDLPVFKHVSGQGALSKEDKAFKIRSSTIPVDPVCFHALLAFMALAHFVCVPISFISGIPGCRNGQRV